MNDRLTAALDYAARGWYVVPLNPQSKVLSWEMSLTLAFDWYGDDPAPDAATIQRWFELEPELNVGIRMDGSGLAVLDIDELGHLHKVPGFEPDGLPLTPSVRTARGKHVYFRAPEEGIVSGQVRVFQPPEPSLLVGDFLTTYSPAWKGGGPAYVPAYVVAPPSRHPDGLTTYQWLDRPDVPLAEVPDWLLLAVVPPMPPSSWFADLADWPEEDEAYHDAMAADFEWDENN